MSGSMHPPPEPPSRYCPHHDELIDHRGKCPACYTADEEYAEHERDTLHLWRTR